MDTKTTYLRPPPNPQPKGAKGGRRKPKTPWEEFRSGVYQYRVQIIPYGMTFGIITLCLVVAPYPFGTPALAGTALACAGMLYRFGERFKLRRKLERWYGSGCAAVVSLWILYATWYDERPSGRSVLVLLVGTGILAAPFWYHRRIRGSVPVRCHGLDARTSRARLRATGTLVRGWVSVTSACRLDHAKLKAVDHTQWMVQLKVQLKLGKSFKSVTLNDIAAMESAFPAKVRPGSGRVKPTEDAQTISVSFMLGDPHKDPLPPPDETTADRIILGLFENGEGIVFKLLNTLIGGTTGAGKSMVLNIIIRALARIPNVALILVDLKPGAPEFSPWRGIAHTVVTTPEQLKTVLTQLKAGMEYRGDLMAQRGWKAWRPSRSQPHIVTIIDEVQQVKRVGLGDLLDEAIGLVRAYAINFIVATQYPTDKNVSQTVKEQCPQKIGLAVEDSYGDAAIFGPQGRRQGWVPSELPMEGYLLMRSPQYRSPMRGRAFYMSEDDVPAEVQRLSAQRTVIRETWMELEPGEDEPEILDAVVVESSPQETVFNAVQARPGISAGEVAATTGVSRATVYRHLKALEKDGRISKDGKTYTEMA